MTANKARWQYRFDNYTRAYFLLREICERSQKEALEQIAKEGMIQRFEVCMELAWKTIKDYMEHNGFIFAQVLPSTVIKEAAAAKLLDTPSIWLQALDDRNKMRHIYDFPYNFQKFEQVIERIVHVYIDNCFGALYKTLSQVMANEK